MTKNTCLLRTFACLLAAGVPLGVSAQELITNGNFESAALSPWTAVAPSGGSVTVVAENSPFPTIFPAGTRAARIADDDVEFETPSFEQSFAPRNGVRFSFDFKAPAAAPGSAWYVIWRGEEDTTAFFFAIGGQDGVSFDLNQNTVTALEPGLWYHVEGTADVPNQTVSGGIQNSRGQRVTFSGGFPFGVRSVLNGVTVTDGDQARNSPLVVDNFSAQPVAVASASLSIARAPNGEVVVTWTAPGYLLQASPQVGANAEWLNVATVGQTYTVPADLPMQFFRLLREP